MADLNSIQNCRQASVNITASGDNLVLSNATGPVTIYGLTIVASNAVSVALKNGTTTMMFGPIGLVTAGSIDLAPTFERFTVGAGTGTAGGFYINLSGAVQVGGTVYFKYGK